MAQNPEGKSEGRFPSLKDAVVLGISALTLLSTTFQFYVRDYLAPQRQPTALEISSRLEPAGERDGLTLVRLVVRATNPTARRIYVPAIWFAVFGYSVPARPCDAEPDWQAALTTSGEQLHASFNAPRAIDIVAQRRVFADGSAWYEPNDVTNFEDVVVVPAGRYDYLKLMVQYIHGRSVDALADSPIEWKAQNGEWFANPRFETGGPIEWAEDAGGGLNFFETVLALARADARPSAGRPGAVVLEETSPLAPCAG